jgi:hypothetical protein
VFHYSLNKLGIRDIFAPTWGGVLTRINLVILQIRKTRNREISLGKIFYIFPFLVFSFLNRTPVHVYIHILCNK